MQLLWMGPQTPSGPQVLFTRPVLFTGQGACATWPALVTFQATTAESSGQVVSPSEEGYQGELSNRSLAPGSPWAETHAGSGTRPREAKGPLPGQAGERSASWTLSPTYPG